jgi:hypothetical protein
MSSTHTLTFLASSAWIAGNAMPCAMPSTARAASSGHMPALAASGVSTVASDQPTSPAASTALPPKRSLSWPPSTCVAPYPAKNADMTTEQNCLFQPYCSAIGTMAVLMLVRSR